MYDLISPMYFVRELRLVAHLGTVARHMVFLAAVEAWARPAPWLPKGLSALLLHHVRLHRGLHLLHHHRLLHHRVRPWLQHHAHVVVVHERLCVGSTIVCSVEEMAFGLRWRRL